MVVYIIHIIYMNIISCLIQSLAAIIQVRLTRSELMQIILLAHVAPFPGRAPKVAQPVVWRLSLPVDDLRVPPDVVLVVRFDPLNTLLEPWMLVRAVIGHEVQNHFELELPGLGYQPVEIGQSSITRVNVREVGNVVAEVDLRARVNRREPEGLRAYVRDVL